MRILLSKQNKKELFEYFKKRNNCNSLKSLSKKLKIPLKTLSNWCYNENRYIPEKLIPRKFIDKIKIIDKQSDNWGKSKGGKATYKILIKKYGEKEIRRRQLMGGKASLLKRDKLAKEKFKLDINNPLFLEFYGALLGDGWLSSLSYNYKYKRNLWWVGISGHSKLDKKYLMFLKDIVKKLFNKDVVIKYKKDKNGMEIIFCHKYLILFMNKKLKFPIGKKINLKIYKEFSNDWSKMIHIIRGVLDTDGNIYVNKNIKKGPYPRIIISMKAPLLIKQIYNHLINKNFRVSYYIEKKGLHRITLNGREQLNKWMKEIGSSNPKHLNKIWACSSVWKNLS